ncbi:MAG TPA: sulfotransferase [Acidimicrobiia bacterium]|nr:sulfotransferase [Acidimicrobiia bacterium]
MEPTTVVYIAGYGRSGSTLLDLLLGRLDGWFSMGEFRLFWWALRDHWRCGCGHDVEDCPVWSAVLADAKVAPVLDVIADLRETVRVRRVPALVRPALLGSHRAARDRFAATLDAIYGSTQRVTGARVLVDSSKDPMYGLVMCSLPNVRVHVVHLVRDSRAVTFSWQRKKARPEIEKKEAFLPQHGPLHTSLEWDLRHSLVQVLGREAPAYTRVTYEALASDPIGTLDRITEAVVGRSATELGASFERREVENHTVAGNPMRFQPVGLDLRVDEEWRGALPARDRRLVTTLTYPLLRKYGYH